MKPQKRKLSHNVNSRKMTVLRVCGIVHMQDVQINQTNKEKSSRQTKFAQERIFEEIRTLPLPFYWRSITACKGSFYPKRKYREIRLIKDKLFHKFNNNFSSANI